MMQFLFGFFWLDHPAMHLVIPAQAAGMQRPSRCWCGRSLQARLQKIMKPARFTVRAG
jgi:hypothetical protein